VSTPTTAHWAGSVNTLWGHTYYIGLSAIILNIAAAAILTLVLRAVRVPAGTDGTLPHQYTDDPVDAPAPAPAGAMMGSEMPRADLP
jgi:solute:Na+ symporter, SSS family